MIDTSQLTPQFELQMLLEGNSAHPWFDRAIMKFDGVVFPAIEDRDILTPPASPISGQMWLIDGVASGDWQDHDDELALYYEPFGTNDKRDNWFFFPVFNGLQIWIKDEDVLTTYVNDAWFVAGAITNCTTDLNTQKTAINAIITALEGHRFLSV